MGPSLTELIIAAAIGGFFLGIPGYISFELTALVFAKKMDQEFPDWGHALGLISIFVSAPFIGLAAHSLNEEFTLHITLVATLVAGLILGPIIVLLADDFGDHSDREN